MPGMIYYGDPEAVDASKEKECDKDQLMSMDQLMEREFGDFIGGVVLMADPSTTTQRASFDNRR